MKTEVTVTLVLTKEEFTALREFLGAFCTADIVKRTTAENFRPMEEVIESLKKGSDNRGMSLNK